MSQAERSALIVGASRGLGLGLVETLLARGWRVTATQRAPAPDLARLGTQALRIETADIDDDASVAALRERLSSERFDLVFVVAGVATQAQVPAHEMERTVAAQVFQTNAISPIRFAEAFADRVTPGGIMAFMTSILGSVALNESGGWESYRASKAALNTLARSFALRHRGEDFGVVLMHPGWVRTDMGGAGADIDVATSAAGMADVIDGRLGREGCVYLDYRGTTLPW